jgi:hypothetical protein
MSQVNELIVREYFESLGFIVGQPCKYVVPGRRKRAEEEIDLIVVNPQVEEQKLSESIVWTTADLSGVARAVVGVRGWHTERFSAAIFEQTPEILRFAEDAAVSVARKKLGVKEGVAKILCVAALPASGDLKKKAVAMLKEKGIDGILVFRTILEHLAATVDKSRNYEKSDVLQTIRILKSHGLLKTDQMELFEKRRKRSK